MKTLIISIITLLLISTNSFAGLITNGSLGGSSNQEFSENQFGFGLSVAKEFNVIKGVLLESENDYIFNEIGIFSNYYGDKIDYNYGANISFGYGYKKLAGYLSGGYVQTHFNYQDSANSIDKDFSEGAGFVGVGISYKITDSLKTKLDFINYSLSFNPNQSNPAIKNELDVKSTTLGLQLYF